jgi:hypothetical protein
MSDWYDTFDSVFWLSLSVGIFGFLGIAIKSCLKSKCSDTSICWGMFNIKRDTQAELEENEFEIDHGIVPPPTPTPPPPPNRV